MTYYKIKDIPKSDQPREKLIKHGPQFLSNSELLAILIGSGYKGKNVLQLAKDTLKKFQTKNLPKLSYKQLISQKGIGPVAACRILAAFELTQRLLLDQEEAAKIIKKPGDVFKLLKEIGNYKKEHFIGLYLNARNQLIHQETISIGSLDVSIVHPREVFEPALSRDGWTSAAQDVLYFNTPSRSGTTVQLEIRTGSHSGTLKDTLVEATPNGRTYQYYFGANSYNASSGYTFSGYTQNHDLQEATGGPSPHYTARALSGGMVVHHGGMRG